MRNRLMVVGLVTVLGVHGSTVHAEPKDKEEDQVKATLRAMWAVIEAGNVESYAEFIHPDFTAFGETDTYRSDGKDLEVRSIREWLKRAQQVHTEMHQPKVTVKDNLAWISYYWTDSGIEGGKPFSSRGKSTRIFVKENETWLCIHAHHTLVP